MKMKAIESCFKLTVNLKPSLPLNAPPTITEVLPTGG